MEAGTSNFERNDPVAEVAVMPSDSAGCRVAPVKKLLSTKKRSKGKKRAEESVVYSHLEKLRLALHQLTSSGICVASIDTIRYTTAKVLCSMRTSDGSIRLDDSLLLLATVLEKVQDLECIKNVISIVQTVLTNNSVQSAVWTCKLVEANFVGALFGILNVINKSSVECDALALDVYGVIAQLATKDAEFPTKAKNSNVMKLAAATLKRNFSRVSVIKPILVVFKAAIVSNLSCGYIGKECIYTLLCLSESLDHGQSALMKLTLDTIRQLMKSSSNRRELIYHSGVPKLLNLLNSWGQADEPHKLRILRIIMACLISATEGRIGQTAVLEASGISFLYDFCQELPLSVDYDHIVSLCTLVILKCLPPKWLPLENFFSAVTFDIPGKIVEAQRTASHWKELKASGYNSVEHSSGSSSSSSEDETVGNEFHRETIARKLVSEELKSYERFMPESQFATTNLDPLFDGKSPDSTSKQDEQVLLPNSLNNDSCKMLPKDALHSILLSISLPKKDSQGLLDRCFPALCKDGCLCSTCMTFSNSCFPGLIERSMSERRKIEKFLQSFDFTDQYAMNSVQTKHVVPFIKLAYPDITANTTSQAESLHQKNLLSTRTKLLKNIDRLLESDSTAHKIVYDYDALVEGMIHSDSDVLQNIDETRVGISEEPHGVLKFESRFESGNLRKVLMIGPYNYELILNPDVNSDHHHQWFYFEVFNMEAHVPYYFSIVNCEKGTSQFGLGMKPVLYSVQEAVLGRPGWTRCGTDVCYYRNYYSCLPGSKGRSYYTTYFSVIFPHAYDVCYIAYHYPYTYTTLKNHLKMWDHTHISSSVFYRKQVLCQTLSGNDVPILTITGLPMNTARQIILLSGRVHPGETNSSWIMKGTVDYLLSDKPSAETVRDKFIFKIVPMLNPDGVINGCHRCSLSAEDLNRCWLDPSPHLQPAVYHMKSLILYMQRIGKLPFVFCDYHGHSRRKNVFLFGCNSRYSWSPEDRKKKNNGDVEILPRLLDQLAPAFSILNCNFEIEKNREATARVTIWRQFGVKFSYTLESTYCGCDQGPYKDLHISISHLLEMGAKFCQGVIHLHKTVAEQLSSE